MKIDADYGIRRELSDYFSFYPPNYQFNPKYKNKIWDGLIRLYSSMKPGMYIGLLPQLEKFCSDRGYQLIISDRLKSVTSISKQDVQHLAQKLNIPLELYDYQIDYIVNAITNNRSLSLSPTSSGKSLIIYLIQQYYHKEFGHRTLIIVPTTSLVYQIRSDFIEYGCNEDDIYTIMSGVEKTTKKPIVISTWQSLIKQPKQWFDQFRVVLGDEAHLFQSKSLTTIMENLTEAPYRHGFTGTISSESQVHKLVLEGLFGTVEQYVTTKQLIDRGTVADFKVKGIVLKHSPEVNKVFNDAIKQVKAANMKSSKKVNLFNVEKEFIANLEKRNNFIKNLVWSLEGQNNLILFDRVEKHGKVLEPLLRKEDRILHFIHGDIKGKERDDVRYQIENDNLHVTCLHFGDKVIEVPDDQTVHLTDGTSKKASDITVDDDVSQVWINMYIK